MVDPESKRPLTPEDADVDLQVRAFGEHSSGAQTSFPQLSSTYSSLHDARIDCGQEMHETEPRYMDDPHGTAVMVLTALSSGIPIAPRNSPRATASLTRLRSDITHLDSRNHSPEITARGFPLGPEVIAGRSTGMRRAASSSSTSLALSISPIDEARVVRDEHEGYATSDRETGRMTPILSKIPRDSSMMVRIKPQAGARDRVEEEQDAAVESEVGSGSVHSIGHPYHPPAAAKATCASPPTPSIAITSSLFGTTVPSSSSSASQHVFDSQNLVAMEQQPLQHVPGERIQSQLSNLLKDRLSLALLKAQEGWGEMHLDSRKQARPPVRSWDEDQREQVRGSLLLSQAPKSQPSMIQDESLHHQRDIRPFPPSMNRSASPLMTSMAVRSKHKHTKKVSMSEIVSHAELSLQSAQERELLLHPERGLILKTQIPKKGRPVSKHSTISLSTPTLSSFGILPASHPYFSSKTGTSSPSTLLMPISAQYPSVRPVDPQQQQHSYHPPRFPSISHPTNTQKHFSASIVPMNSRHTQVPSSPGCPPLTSTTTRHSHEHDAVSEYALPSEPSHRVRSPPLPCRAWSPSLSSVASLSTPKPQQLRHSHPKSQEQQQLMVDSRHSFSASSGENKHFSEDQHFHGSLQSESLPPSSTRRRSYVEGVPIQNNSRKRDSYGTEKQRSSEDHYRLEDVRRSMPSVANLDGREGELYQDRLEQIESGRFRKRLSRSDVDMTVLRTGTRTDDVEAVHAWLNHGSDRHQQRPHSLVIPRGKGDSVLSQTMAISSSSYVLRDNLALEAEDEEIPIHGSEARDAKRIPTNSRPIAAVARSLHRHARSLDFSVHPASQLSRSTGYQQLHHRQPPPSHHGHCRHASHDLLVDHGHKHLQQDYPSPHGHTHPFLPTSSSSTFEPDTHLSSRSAEGREHCHAQRDHGTEFCSKADQLARDISSGGGKGQSTTVPGGLAKTPANGVVKRTLRKGPGPYLKKHQILQQQLQQMQREQEELEIRLTLQQQQQNQNTQFLQQQQRLPYHQQNQSSEIRRGQQQPYHQRQRQHPLTAHVDPEHFGLQCPDQQQQQQHYQQQQQPLPGRPPKQRVLQRSENVSPAIHTLYSSPSDGSAFSPPQHLSHSPTSQQHPPSSTATTVTDTTTQPRRRQNYHQPILLRPVSLSSLIDTRSTSPYYNQPPPGQPLYRSLHAPYLVSPSSLTSVASNTSSSTNPCTPSLLHAGSGGGVHSPTPESPLHSPAISLLTTPLPASAPIRLQGRIGTKARATEGMSLHSPLWSHHEFQGYQRSQKHQQQQQQQASRQYGGTMSRSRFRGGKMMSANNSSSVLARSRSQQSLHRHTASLPTLHYTPQQQPASPAHYQSSSDPTLPPIHRMMSYPDKMTAHRSSTTGEATLLPPLDVVPDHQGLPAMATNTLPMMMVGRDSGLGGEENDPVQGLLIRTPPRDT